MQRIAVYPGTFDPITNGHVDVIERASQMFHKIIVVVAVNSKKEVLFSDEERCELAVESLKNLPNVDVEMHRGLIIEYARAKNAIALIRGNRAISDFEYEFQLALMNRKLVPEIKTIFLMPHER